MNGRIWVVEGWDGEREKWNPLFSRSTRAYARKAQTDAFQRNAKRGRNTRVVQYVRQGGAR
jgi:hypothetical protein